jgi:hypothetical protein
MIGNIARALLARVAARLPVRVITGEGGDPYLYKFLVWQSGEGRDTWRVHLHRFVRSDADRELHNHPWRWAVSLILAGGYREEYRTVEAKPQVAWQTKRPGSINVVLPSTFHRVDLLEHDCWTLFVSGPVVQSWGFWDRFTGAFTPWREFFAAKGLTPTEGEYWKAVRRG